MQIDLVALVPAFMEIIIGEAEVEGGLAQADELDRSALDFSLESLAALDRYLDQVHAASADMDEQVYTNTALAAGFYLGEVIRRNGKLGHEWVNYEDLVEADPELSKVIPHALGSAAMLVAEDGGVTMPINRVIGYIEEGAESAEGTEHSTRTYADEEVMREEGDYGDDEESDDTVAG